MLDHEKLAEENKHLQLQVDLLSLLLHEAFAEGHYASIGHSEESALEARAQHWNDSTTRKDAISISQGKFHELRSVRLSTLEPQPNE